MIPKKDGYSPNPLNYRPISLVSCIGKVVERIINARLMRFLEAFNLISKMQSGFRKGRSTKDNLLFLTQKVTEAMARGKKCLAIFFDIAKAFDKVWHDELIYKMIKLGVPRYIILWVKIFLTNRNFKVRVNECLSPSSPISAGVPQGAPLRPILFSIFINDIPLHNERNISYFLQTT
jgi:retron-type reverse transcriptase